MITFATMSPDVDNNKLRAEGKEEHAAPRWLRLTCKDKNTGRMRGEGHGKKPMEDDDE